MTYLTAATLLFAAAFAAALYVIRQHGYVATVSWLAGALYDHAMKTKQQWDAREARVREQWASRMAPAPERVVSDDERQREFERNALGAPEADTDTFVSRFGQAYTGAVLGRPPHHADPAVVVTWSQK